MICFSIGWIQTFSRPNSKEVWLASAFNLHVFDHSQRTAPDPEAALKDDSEILHSTDSEAGEAVELGEHSRQCFQATDSEEEEIFPASDEEAEACPAKRRKYTARDSTQLQFLGLDVCRFALAKLIGVGNSTIEKLRKGHAIFTNNLRPPLPKHPHFKRTLKSTAANMVWEGILMFLWLLYHLEAEAMPNRYTLPGEKTLESPFPENCSDPRDPDLVQRLVNGFRQTMQTQATDVDTSLIGPGTFKGAVKALPHMTRTELYWEYAAFAECRGIATGSYGTFMKAINKVIGPNIRDGHLRFRATNEHGQCDTCFELRKACREAKTEAARREARSRHHMHVLSQWLDRQIYWSFRTLSYNFFSTVLQANGRLLDLNWNSKLSYFACGAQLFRFPCLS